MILVDTSVWVDHLRCEDRDLARMLAEGRVLMHEYVIGELAVGSMRNWQAVMLTLLSLPRIDAAPIENVAALLRREKLYGSGIGFVDAALLAATLGARGPLLWARDKRLAQCANSLGIHYMPD